MKRAGLGVRSYIHMAVQEEKNSTQETKRYLRAGGEELNRWRTLTER